uniref:Polyprotein n=1 Tax=Oryza sativa subsp. japonica TaxID=39947 RepID=Q8H838_ORYSJ|nr:putative polyprotein [Oryza sativa Japonica Group]
MKEQFGLKLKDAGTCIGTPIMSGLKGFHYLTDTRQQIQLAIEGGKIKFTDSKKPMKVDGNPFPVNMVHTSGRTANEGKHRSSQLNLARIINKYQRRHDKQQERHFEEKDGGFDPHWDCEFFRFCWNEGMRLPSIEDCPGCSDNAGSLSRSYNRGNRLSQKRVSVHQRERFQKVQEINHWLKKTKQEWLVKSKVTTADEVEADKVKRLIKGKTVACTLVNMVFMLPAEFKAKQADVDDVEEASARLILSPEQAIFEKPEGTENQHLKPLYVNGFVNGKPMSKMMVDGGAAVNLMPYAIFRKLGKNTDDLIKTNMILKDFGGNPSETKGVLNVELTISSKTVPTTQLKMESPNYYFDGVVEGSNVYTKNTVDDLDDKQGHGFMSADDLEEVDIGPGDRPRPIFISKNLFAEFRTMLIELLKEYRDCFAWEYYEMPGLSRLIVEHRLPIKPGFKPHQQPPRRCKAQMYDAIKAEITRLYDAVLKGLQLLKEVEANAMEIMGDSLLVINQLAGEYECKNDVLMIYNEKCRELMNSFRPVTLKYVSREQNVEANNLAQGASGYKPMMKDIEVELAAITADDWRVFLADNVRGLLPILQRMSGLPEIWSNSDSTSVGYESYYQAMAIQRMGN